MASNEVSQNFEYKNAGFLNKWDGPFATKEAACLAIENKVDEDTGRNFREGKLPYIGVAPNLVRYEWRGGFGDGDLVEVTEGLAKTGGSNKTIADLIGASTVPQIVRQNPTKEINSMGAFGGSTHQAIFNNFSYNYQYPYTKIGVRSFASQDVTILKLAADGTTVTNIKTQSVSVGVNELILENPVQLNPGERIGIKGSGSQFAYANEAGTLGSRLKDGTGTWINSSTIEWGYWIEYTIPVTPILYPNIKTLSEQFEIIKGATSPFAAKTDLAIINNQITQEANERKSDVSNVKGYSTSPTETTQKPIGEFSAMASSGGANNLACINLFPFLTGVPVVKMSLRSQSAQTLSVIKLAADQTTVTILESHSVPSGISTITLTSPVVLAEGEMIGFDLGAVNMFYGGAGDVGSRNQNSAGVWANTGSITWGYSVIYSVPPAILKYNTIKKLSDKIVEIEEDGVTEYADRPSGGVEKFQVSVNSIYPNYTGTSVAVKDSESIHTDDAAIALPVSYTKSGRPTRLVLYCHGAGSAVNASTNNLGSTRLVYLLAKGYACLDVNGLPASVWESGEDPNKCAGMGGQIALQCYIKAYEYVINKYNLRKDGVFLLGTSMGGLTSSNLLANTSIPFMAQCLEAPITHLYEQAWLRPWFGGAKGTRFQIAKYYNFDNYQTFDFVNATTQQREDYWQANKHKVSGFDPANFQAYTINSIKAKPHKIPLLIIHSVFDTTSLIASSQNYVSYIKNAGGNAQLRSIDDGNVYSNQHAPMSFTSDVTDPEDVTTKATVREMYLFFKRFDS